MLSACGDRCAYRGPMSPRGIPTPDVRNRLIAAAGRVVRRDGPGAVSARTVAKEADCAIGVLYKHFEDLDDLLAAVVVDWFEQVVEALDVLADRAGHKTVAENLAEGGRLFAGSPVPVIVTLVQTRPGVLTRLLKALEAGRPGLPAIERAFEVYLEAEQRLGRVDAGADPRAAAVTLVGALHHAAVYPALTGTPDDPSAQEAAITRVVDSLLRGLTR